MAKIKSKLIREKVPLKECRVELKRLSRRTLDRFLNPNRINYNISAKIQRDKMKIGKTTITSTDGSFDITIKKSANGISISQSKKETHQRLVSLAAPQSSGRVLRPRLQATAAMPAKSNSKPTRNLAVTKAQSNGKIVDASLNGAWRKCKNDNKENYFVQVNDIVMAKVRGHLAWPAIVKDIVNKNNAKVEFFGAKHYEKYGFVNIKEITPFANSIDVIRLTLKKNNPKFNKAISETEIACGVPFALSIKNN